MHQIAEVPSGASPLIAGNGAGNIWFTAGPQFYETWNAGGASVHQISDSP